MITQGHHGDPASRRIAEYLLYRAALPVFGRKYRSFNYARAR
jgi:hypothetical protein